MVAEVPSCWGQRAGRARGAAAGGGSGVCGGDLGPGTAPRSPAAATCSRDGPTAPQHERGGAPRSPELCGQKQQPPRRGPRPARQGPGALSPRGLAPPTGLQTGTTFAGRGGGGAGSGSRSLSKFPARVSEPKSPQAQPRGCERGSRGSAPRGGVRNRLTAGGSLGIVVFPLSPPFIFEARFLCRRRGQARAWVFQLRSRRRGVGVSRSGSGARHARGFISRVGNGVEAAGSRQEAAAKAVLSGSRAGTRGTPQPPSLPLGCSLGSGQG